MRADYLPDITQTKGFRSAPLGPAVKRLTPEEVAGAYTLLEHVEHLYPGFRLWFARKVIPGCVEGSRAVFTTVDRKSNEISGIAILKRDLCEQKICTLFVHPDHTGRGNGTRLLAEGLTWLDNPRPIITVGEKRYKTFSRLLERQGFELTAKVYGLYRPAEAEYVFNDFAGLYRASLSPRCGALPYDPISEQRNVNTKTRPHSSSADTTLSGNLNWDAYS
jgi:GNAT superfamily N-acetyltransferase